MRKKALSALSVLTALVCVCLAQAGRTQSKHDPAPSPRAEMADRKSVLKDTLRKLLPDDVAVTDESVRDAARPRADETYTMLRINWAADDPKAPGKVEVPSVRPFAGPPFDGRTMRVTGRRKMKGSLARPRSLNPNSDDLLMVAVGADGQARYWYAFADPRLTSVEELPLPGESTGKPRRTFHHSRTTFYVGVPADPEIRELRFYHPRWTGSEHVLDAMGTIHF